MKILSCKPSTASGGGKDNMKKAKVRQRVRCYRIGNNHERILVWEDVREVSRPQCGCRRIGERDCQTDGEWQVNLNELAAQLPAGLEGQWIVELVRSFGVCRGIHSDAALLDAYQESVIVAVRAAQTAAEKGGSVAAFVKRAVRLRLTDLQRAEDYRDARLNNDSTRVMMRCPFGDFRIALQMITPGSQRVWELYRRHHGYILPMAESAGTTHYLMGKAVCALAAELSEALAYVRCIRGKKW